MCLCVCVHVCVYACVCDVLQIGPVFASLAACLDCTIDGLLRAPAAHLTVRAVDARTQLNVKPGRALQTK